jgi:signal transduction histidine kinase
VIVEAYVKGVSTRKVDDLVRALGIDGISRSEVSRICKVLDEEVKTFLARPIDGEHPYVWLDATFHKVRLTVENSGPPVPLYEIPSLFEPFRRVANLERRANSIGPHEGRGAGLGLSIVRSVVHAHEGDVHASPREDGGLIVKARIPVAPETSVPSVHG